MHLGSLKRPPVLDHYLSTNDVLPYGGLPTLNGYLTALASKITALEDEARIAHAIPHAKKDEHAHLKREHDICIGIKHPIRVLAPEVLGQIFAFALITPESSRFSDIARLRGICSLWRQVALATPGLWKNVTIDLHKWWEKRDPNEEDSFLHLGEQLSSSMATLNRTRPYHLTLMSSGQEDDVENDESDEYQYQRELIRHLLSATPQPGFVNFNSMLALIIAERLTTTCESVAEVEVMSLPFWEIDSSWALGEGLFPHLKFLTIHGELDFCGGGTPWGPPLAPSGLHTLHLENLSGEAYWLRSILRELRGLTELKLNSDEDLDETMEDESQGQSFIHHSLQTIIMSREDLLVCLRGFHFPNLRLLAIQGHGATGFFPDDDSLQIPAKSPSDPPLLISLRGRFPQETFNLLMSRLPPSTHLHLDVSQTVALSDDDEEETQGIRLFFPPQYFNNLDAIYFGEDAQPLFQIPLLHLQRDRSSHPMILNSLLCHESDMANASLLQAKLQPFNIEAQMHTAADLASALRSLAPQPSEYSKTWWNF
jgi:F-box-like